MGARRGSRLDVGGLLAAVENAAPVAAADVVGELLAQTMGASEVAFLIADFSADALIRLSHARGPSTRTSGGETAERVALEGSAHGQPFALWGENEYRVQPLQLAPGDRLVFLTDGMLERNAFSLNIEALVAQGHQMHPREAVQHLIRAVLKRTGGLLKDDAAVMCFDWHGGSPRLRTSHSGADR